MDEIQTNSKAAMEKAINALQSELKKVRTGKANVSMLDSVVVDYYGNPSPLNQVAAVSCPDAKSFLITPWEASILKNIEASIIKSNIGMSPQNDGKAIRLRLPDLTEDRRKDLVKNIKKILEDSRIAIRKARRDANEILKTQQKNKEISEDDLHKGTDDIQKITDDFIKKVDVIGADKEKELLTI